MEVEHEDREKQFLANLSEQHEIALRRISEIYREKMAATEKSYLQQKQTVSNLALGYLKQILIRTWFLGNENSWGNDVGAWRETHTWEASTVKTAR